MALTSAEAARIRFERTGRGYRRRDVEEFRRQVVASLLAIERNIGEQPVLQAADVEGAEFGWVLGGYDHEPVDAFLERVARILRAFEAANPDIRTGRPARPKPIAAAELAAATFTVVFRGYRIAAVDRFLKRVVGEIESCESGRPLGLTSSNEVARKLFDVSMRGYAEHEVDAKLDRAAETLRHYERGLREKRTTG